MTSFKLQIAGQTAQVRAMFASTRDYCARYLTEDAPDLFIGTSPADLLYEQQELLEEALAEGFRPRVFTDPFLERASIQRKLAEHLLDHQTLLLHGSAVAVDGEGYLFTARSGTGKSTHTRLWCQVFGSRALMVNDDKPFLQIFEEGIFLCGAPWSGKHGLDTNCRVPLKGICLLERGEDRIRRIGPADALPLLRKQAYRSQDKQSQTEDLLQRLAHAVPLWHLTCTPTPQAVHTAYPAMSAP